LASYAVGVDLGQVQDYTAIAVVGLDDRYLAQQAAREEAYERLSRARQDPHLDEIDLRIIEREIDEGADSVPGPVYEVRHLERLPLGTRYPEVVGRVKALLNTSPLADECALAVDATGVGVAVTDMLRNAGLYFSSVTITSGEKATREGSHWRVPKRDLISACQVLLQQRRLKIAASLPEAKTLTEELLNFRYKITQASNLTYESWREGAHDDLVLALSLAVWEAEKGLFGVEVDESLVVANTGPFTITEKDLYRLDEPYYRW
jgi:hypothetical protein